VKRAVLFWVLLLLLSPGGGAAASPRAGIPFLKYEGLARIQEKISANGYAFTVAENWLTKLPREQREGLRSRRHGTEILRQASGACSLGPLREYLGRPLPERFDWRDVMGRCYLGPIRQQGGCGACYAFSACAAAEAVYNAATGSWNENCIDFSEAFVAFCLSKLYSGFDGCYGSNYEYEELSALVQDGVCEERVFPYDPKKTGCSLELPVATVRFSAWHRLPCNDVAAIKAAIRWFGAVDASVLTNSAFDAYHSGLYDDGATVCEDVYSGVCYYAVSDHTVALVGWDDNGGDGYWILRNSWGKAWGEEGYMRIKYRAAHVACAACYLVYDGALLVEPEAPVLEDWLPLLLDED